MPMNADVRELLLQLHADKSRQQHQQKHHSRDWRLASIMHVAYLWLGGHSAATALSVSAAIAAAVTK